ncbi:hypothetical protein [Pseudoalteromonas luteoviolacea]|uniref:Uncharacterized protein n=1 Tax=Pseudoalteromonas luteoviolacea S4054 TaxID=1129367 RepID=A0A0F6A9S9_9GAMM|nr:hypothetical protein [Pseudoalteromonas luteoviolacea]AOT07066.1 hypothetical protein S4054249_03895 [Pseudoalteromonas luteoviolacea]AOT11983.1 hypothetical protein S40542_03895 [Pseudoalteromonas luteoviolacea]AOT16896.1 hypothetical protein S4054_03895 [Pseudoalteromonas luteoviolacea]KKE82606.1 hypothetical protein N479_17500 [Pseudoalteromonas luteoviolacea S4054]KZN69960.1 hypothetical protein N481_21325 [Pseudoalteromonas luteoviolacea S4047-1]
MSTNNEYFNDVNAFSSREHELIRKAFKQGYLQGKEDGINGIHVSSRVIENALFTEEETALAF